MMETHFDDLARQVDRAKSGDRDAFTILIRSTQSLVYGLAYAKLGEYEEARDATQDTFVKGWRTLRQLHDPRQFRAWIRRIALNECRMRLRARRIEPLLSDEPSTMPTDIIARLELEQALQSLSDENRETLFLFCFRGESIREIAEFLGVPDTAVMSRLRNARAQLKLEMFDTMKLETAQNRLPEDFAERVPLAYDEYDWRTTTPRTPEPFGDFRRNWLLAHLPSGTSIVSVEMKHEEHTRVVLQLPDGQTLAANLQYTGRRHGVEDDAAMLPVLAKLGLPVARVLAPPVVDPAAPERGSLGAFSDTPGDENMVEWVTRQDLAGQNRACDLMLEASDRITAATSAVMASAVGETLERASLADELRRTVQLGGPWLADDEFAAAVRRLEPIVGAIDVPLVFSNGGNPPHVVRVTDGAIAGFAGFSWARLEDPHYGVTKYWTYDSWPFRQLGFVERYMVRQGISMAELAPRLAVRALVTLHREVPVRGENGEFRDSLRGWLRQAMAAL